LTLRRSRGDERGAIQPLAALGQIALQQGDHKRARALLEETLATLAQYDDPWARAMSLVLLGHVELAEGDPERALAHVLEAAAIFEAIENPLYVPWVLEGLAGVAVGCGAWERSARLCGARDALHASLGLGMPPADPAAYTHTVTRCCDSLGEDRFVAAHAAGGQLSPVDALAEGEQLQLVVGSADARRKPEELPEGPISPMCA
jgi:hypothetical protein